MGNLTATENTTQIQLTSTIWKGGDGWEGRTNTAEDGAGYQIITSKGRKGLRSYAQKGTFVNGSFTFMMFSDKSIDLATTDAKCTENSVRALHEEGLKKFLELTADEPETYKIPIGQRLICYGYAMNEEAGDWIIYQINSSVSFNAVDVKNYKTRHFDHVRDIEEKFGIGTYYAKNDLFEGTTEELNAIVEQSIERQAKKDAEIKAENDRIKAENLQKFEAGNKIVSVPSNAISVIVAEFMHDDSDSQSDYYASHAETTIYLAFSTHKKDLFAEMRKAVLNCDIPEIRAFAEVPNINANGDEKTEDNAEHWEPIDEHREKYSMGAGYYLQVGHSRSGWRIRKDTYINLETSQDLRIATQENRYFCNSEIEPEKTNFEAVQVPEGEIQIIDYSEKAIAVIGDTKPIKDQLKQLGGKFNFRLSCGAGWIFPKTKLDEVQKLFSN